MANLENERLEEICFRNPNWIAESGGWLHSNNILFYFAQSPFFDGTSTNSVVFVQSKDDPNLAERHLGNRQRFEATLSRTAGIEYVVAHDPLQSNTFVEGPAGPEQSRTWVIRKQRREKSAGLDDRVTPMAFYYVINDAIFQAPSAADVLTNRLLTTATALTNVLTTAATLPVFSASYGHTYLPPVSKPTEPQLKLSQRSKENTPVPSSQAQSDVKSMQSTTEPSNKDPSDAQILVNAIRITMLHGSEYMDETPLVGEPGNFRLSKNKESLAPFVGSALQASRLTSPLKESTPKASRAPSPPPSIDTDVPAVASKKSAKSGDRGPTTPGGTIKPPKRRKSKAANSFS